MKVDFWSSESEDSTTMAESETDIELSFHMVDRFDSLCVEDIKFDLHVRDCDRILEEKILSVCASSDTIYDTMKMIETHFDVEPRNQILLHAKTKSRFKDHKTLGFYDINEKSVLWVWGLFMKLDIVLPAIGRTISIKVHKNVTVGKIKQIVFEKTGIPCDSQALNYKGDLLDERETLEKSNIRGNTTICAIIGFGDEFGLDLSVSLPCSAIIYIKVKRWYTILDVKAVIESTSEFPISLQKLIYNGESLKDWKTVADYEFVQNSSLSMEISHKPLHVYVTTHTGEGENLTVEVDAKNSATVDELTDAIPDKEIENADGKQCLFLEDVALMGSKMLGQCGVGSGSILSWERVIQIHVRNPDGSSTRVDLKPAYKIKAVKSRIEESCGIPIELQMLTYSGDELDEGFSLEDCEALFGSLWDLRWNFGGIARSFFWPSYYGIDS